MRIESGIDICYIPDFKKALNNGKESFIRKVFNLSERENLDIAHLAGIFAVKEALMKTSIIEPTQWLDVTISYHPSGKPIATFVKHVSRESIESLDISISHHGDYAVAHAVVLHKESITAEKE